MSILINFLFTLAFALPKGAQVSLTSHGDPRVGTYVSSGRGFETSSYWIEGPSGLIMIDTQFLLSAGEEALKWAEETTGKKVELAIVLHPNPDKFNGTNTYKKRGIKVVTSDQVKALIPAVHADRTEAFLERYKPDYPTELPAPDSFGNQTVELSAGGTKVKAHVSGAGCSGAHVVVQFENHVFPGDLITNGNHSWLELGLVGEWLRRLDEIKEMKPEYIHPGRGANGGIELLVRQEAYLKKIRDIVRAAKPKGEPSEKKLEALLKKIEETYPGYGFTTFIELGLPAVWEAQTKGRK